MKHVSGILLISLVFPGSFSLAQDNLSISTYYPVPSAVHRKLKLQPQSSTPACSVSSRDQGLLYYNSTDNTVYVCNDTLVGWQPLGVGGGTFEEYWNVSGSNLFPRDPAWNVGIGTATPNARLQVVGAIVRSGSIVDTATQVNLGTESAARNSYSTISGGYRNTAYGNYSTVTGGYENAALGDHSVISGGYRNTASAQGAVVSGGDRNTASADYSSVSGGSLNRAAGSFAHVAGGENNAATGSHSFVLGGYGNTASGNYATVIGGYMNTASGDYSLAGGYHAYANATGSFVWADASSATPYYAHGSNTFNVRASAIYLRNSKIHDVAEHLDSPAREKLQAAELVTLRPAGRVGRAARAHDPTLIGAISNTTLLNLVNDQVNPKTGVKAVPVALAGRCYVSVNGEGGTIRAGDPITSSSVPGQGMKATREGKIIGFAMQDENFEDAKPESLVVFVSTGYHFTGDRLRNIEERLDSLERDSKP